MKYLIVQDWSNTHGNHAGMVHMCKLLKEKHPDEYEVYIKTEPVKEKYSNSIIGKLNHVWDHFTVDPIYFNRIYPKEYLQLCQPMFSRLKAGDEVFLLEYLIPWAPQLKLAEYIRTNYPNVRIYALSHLTVKFFREKINLFRNEIKRWSVPVDKLLTLGSSLSQYFESKGIQEDKISTGFHYVDSDYYHKNEELSVHSPLNVIAMGNLQRDYSLLAKVVRNTPKVHYIICHGRTDVGNLFSDCTNVTLKGFLREDELRHQMDIADVSINIMQDTIGSNVITTSLAMGLAMVVSDVGSIRDYCSSDNAIFCSNTPSSFIDAINKLADNRHKVQSMKLSALEYSKRLSINKVHEWFNNL